MEFDESVVELLVLVDELDEDVVVLSVEVVVPSVVDEVDVLSVDVVAPGVLVDGVVEPSYDEESVEVDSLTVSFFT